MSRPSTGAWEVTECHRVELTYLLKNNYIKKGCTVKGGIGWESGGKNTGSISFVSLYTKEEKYIKLKYQVTFKDGTTKDYNTRIELIAVPSNLGKGEVLYMKCPKSGKRCRILYKGYGLTEFISREAYLSFYNVRLYYSTQTSSRLNKYNNRYWAIEKQLEKERKLRKAINYKGSPTKRKQWRDKKCRQLDQVDELRWTKGMPMCLVKAGYKF